MFNDKYAQHQSSRPWPHSRYETLGIVIVVRKLWPEIVHCRTTKWAFIGPFVGKNSVSRQQNVTGVYSACKYLRNCISKNNHWHCIKDRPEFSFSLWQQQWPLYMFLYLALLIKLPDKNQSGTLRLVSLCCSLSYWGGHGNPAHDFVIASLRSKRERRVCISWVHA